MNTLLEAKPRTKTQRSKILDLLLKRGEKGATNKELAELSFAYQTRIFELKEQGYGIAIEYLGDREFNYVLKSTDTEGSTKRKPIANVVGAIIDEDYGGLMDVSSLQELLDKSNAIISRRSTVKKVKKNA